MSGTGSTPDLLSEILVDISSWRETLGRSTTVWADDIAIEPGMWSAFTGHKSADYNIVVCHDGPRATVIPACLDRVAGLGAPCLVMVAGTSLAEVRALGDAGFVCIGAAPFMAAALVADRDDPRVERLSYQHYPEVRGVLEQAYGLSPATASTAIPDRIATMANISLWGVREQGTLVSCVATHTEADVLSIWSMSTLPVYRRQGYGKVLMQSIMTRTRESGTRAVICSASMDGEPLYAALGFRVIERWQLWSRPRWVLGR